MNQAAAHGNRTGAAHGNRTDPSLTSVRNPVVGCQKLSKNSNNGMCRFSSHRASCRPAGDSAASVGRSVRGRSYRARGESGSIFLRPFEKYQASRSDSLPFSAFPPPAALPAATAAPVPYRCSAFLTRESRACGVAPGVPPRLPPRTHVPFGDPHRSALCPCWPGSLLLSGPVGVVGIRIPAPHPNHIHHIRPPAPAPLRPLWRPSMVCLPQP